MSTFTLQLHEAADYDLGQVVVEWIRISGGETDLHALALITQGEDLLELFYFFHVREKCLA